MMDFAPEDPVGCRSIQAITLRQKMLQRSPSRLKRLARRPVLRLKNGIGRSRVATLARVANFTTDRLAPHPGAEIRQVEPAAR